MLIGGVMEHNLAPESIIGCFTLAADLVGSGKCRKAVG
jgi:hypothetical protein